MPSGFQQQEPVRNYGFFKPVPTPQHGQAPDKTVKASEPRTFQPRPAH
jgi:hypothetical protein